MRNIKVAENKLNKVIKGIGNRDVKLPILIRYLNKEFQSLSVKFKSCKGEFFSISGYYSGNNKNSNDSRYNVEITYEINDNIIIKTRLKDLIDQLLIVLIHEFRHGYQDRKRKFRFKNNNALFWRVQKLSKKFGIDFNMMEYYYLIDYDEVDAYAYELAYVLRSSKSETIDNSFIVSRYKKIVATFNQKAYNRFLKKVYLNMNK